MMYPSSEKPRMCFAPLQYEAIVPCSGKKAREKKALYE